MKIFNLSKSLIIADNCCLADNFITRFLGLMGKNSLPDGSGLLITPCNSIHMFFMKIPLDIIFIDKSNTVLCIVENIKPWRLTKIIRNALSTIELPVGTVAKSRTEIGDKLEIVNN